MKKIKKKKTMKNIITMEKIEKHLKNIEAKKIRGKTKRMVLKMRSTKEMKKEAEYEDD